MLLQFYGGVLGVYHSDCFSIEKKCIWKINCKQGGFESANFIIKPPSISPFYCSFFLQAVSNRHTLICLREHSHFRPVSIGSVEKRCLIQSVHYNYIHPVAEIKLALPHCRHKQLGSSAEFVLWQMWSHYEERERLNLKQILSETRKWDSCQSAVALGRAACLYSAGIECYHVASHSTAHIAGAWKLIQKISAQ